MLLLWLTLAYMLRLLLSTGAGGAEVMFHSRASRELNLLDHDDQQYRGWGEVRDSWIRVRGSGGLGSGRLCARQLACRTVVLRGFGHYRWT